MSSSSFYFSDLQINDELLIETDDVMANAIVIRIYPNELRLHFYDQRNSRTTTVIALGSHDEVIRDHLAPTFLPNQFVIGADLLYIDLDGLHPILTTLLYVKVMREGNVIYEIGKSEEFTT